VPEDPPKKIVAKSLLLNFTVFVGMLLPPIMMIDKIYDVIKYGRATLCGFTFLFAFIIDQAKSPITISLL